MKSTRWKKAQKAERGFWEWLNASYADSTFVADVRDYFARLLELTGLEFSGSDRYLDLGCGPTPVYLALGKGKRTALDPLMEYYRDKFSHLQNLTGVEWVTSKVEDWVAQSRFDTVFMFNCLNHCEDLQAIVGKFNSIVEPGGTLVLTQHCHTQEWTQRFFSRTSAFIDTCHPHHFQKEDVVNLLSETFELVLERKIDDFDVERARKTNRSLTRKTLVQRIAGLFTQPDRFTRYIYKVVSRFYRKQLAGRPAISNYLFVFRRKAT